MMSLPTMRRRIASSLAPLTVVLLFVACSSDAAPKAVAPSAPAAALSQKTLDRPLDGAASVASLSGVVSTPAPITNDAPVSAVTIVATDNAYAPPLFRIRAGQPVEVTLENSGQALHDWRIRDVKNAEGKDSGTRLLQSGQTETITIAIEQAGDYTFYCEVHPVDMRGTLVVE